MNQERDTVYWIQSLKPLLVYDGGTGGAPSNPGTVLLGPLCLWDSGSI